MKIGEFIKMERLRRGMLMADLAQKAGIGKSTLSGLENDKYHRFTTIRAVLAALDMTVEDATAAGVEWFEAPEQKKPTNYELVVDYITADPENEERVRRFLAYLDGLKKRGGS